MLYTILISVVFIAEIIITVYVIQNLLRLDRIIIDLDEKITSAKPGLKDICDLSRKISEQISELTQMYADKIKEKQEDATIRFIIKILTSVLLWKLNIKLINKIRRSKALKIIGKGLKLIEIIV
ncbi:MAG: hypothetical protein MJ231_08445 [bacterium]|nr:hypothetical protein [bacterium]